MKLIETVNLMCSNNWEDRFVAEYAQLMIRLSKLDDVLNNTSDTYFAVDDMTRALMLKQRDAMESYKLCLEKRADIAGIDLHLYPIKQLNIVAPKQISNTT